MTPTRSGARQGYDSLGSGLHAVRVELDHSLTRARHQVEQYLDAPGEREPLLRAAEELHQVRGTASIIQCFGVAVLAEEIKQSALDLANGQTTDVVVSQTALTGALVQLSDYIDALLAGFDDCVLVLQPAINELRLGRGKPLLTETDLFVSQMHAVALELPASGGQSRDADAQAKAVQNLTAYRSALVRWLRDAQAVQSIATVGRIAEQIAAEAHHPKVYELWRAMAACVEAILTRALGDLLEVKRLFGRAGQQLQVLAESGEAAAALQIGDLTYQLLFYIGRSRGRGSRAASLRAAFQLDVYLPAPEMIDRLRRHLRGPTTGLLSRVADEIRADLAAVKDTVDLTVRTGGRNSADLAAALGRLKQVSSALDVLGLGVLHRFVVQRIQSLQALTQTPEASLQEWMEFATGILRVEQSLEESLFRQLGKGYRDPEADAEFAQRTPHDSDWRQGLAAVLRESLVNLAKLKSDVDGLLKNGDVAALTDCPRLIAEVASAIDVVGVDRAAESMERIRRFVVDSPLAKLREQPEAAVLFADVIACAEYYLESWRDGLPQSELRLDELDLRLLRLEAYATGLRDEAAVPLAEALESPVLEAGDALASAMAPWDAQAGATQAPDPFAPASPMPAPEFAPPAWAAAEVDEVDPVIREVFLEEAEEVLQTLARRIPKWLREPKDREALVEIRRAFHTLKGSGRMVGATRIGDFAFAIENLLNRCLDGTIPASGMVADVVRETLDRLPGLIEDFRHGRESPAEVDDLVDRAHLVASDREAAEAAELRDVFRRDANDRLVLVQAWLHQVPRDDIEFDLPNEVVRAFHTLRGAGLLVGAGHIGEVSGRIEDYFESLRGGGLALPRAALPLLDDLILTLRSWVDLFGRDPGATPDFDTWIRRIDALQSAVPESAVRDASDRQLAEIFAGEAFELVETIETSIRAWARAPDAAFHARDIKSALHTLHGAALMSSCPPMSAVAQALHERVDSFVGSAPRPLFFARLLKLCEGLFQILDAYHDGERAGDASMWLAFIAALDPKEVVGEAAEPVALQPPARLAAVEVPGPLEVVGESDSGQASGVESQAPDPGLSALVSEAVHSAAQRDADTDHHDQELRDIFQEEAAELMQSAEQLASQLADDGHDRVAAAELRRVMHTLKGSARMAGFSSIGDIALRLEQLAESLARSRREADGEFFAQLAEGVRAVCRTLDLPVGEVLERLAQILPKEPVIDEPDPQPEILSPVLGPESDQWWIPAPVSDAPPQALDPPAFRSDPDTSAELPVQPASIADFEPSLESSAPSIGEPEWQSVPPEPAQFEDPFSDATGLDRPTPLLEPAGAMDFDRPLEPDGLQLYDPEPIPFDLDPGAIAVQDEPAPEPVFQALEPPEEAVPPHDRDEPLFSPPPWSAEPNPLYEPLPVLAQPPWSPQAETALGMSEADLPPAGAFDPELAEIFSAEATELLEALDEAFRNWSRDLGDEAALRDLQRTLHTLKGGARMAGLLAMGSVAHEIESRVGRIEYDPSQASPAVLAALGEEIESLHQMQDVVLRGDIPEAPAAVAEFEPGPLLPELESPPPVSASPESAPPVAAPRTESGFDPMLFWQPEEELGGLAASRRELARVPVERLDSMLNEAGEISIFRSRLEQHNVSLQTSLKDMAQTIERVRDQLRLMDIETEAQIAARGLSRNVEQDRYSGEFDPLEMDRYSRMQELSRALSESLGDVAALQRSMDQVVDDSETLLIQQGRINTEVQTGLMSTLMVPFVRQVQRLQRVVRQTASENGKQVEIEFTGIEAELDRNVLERMTAPLEHLLRNAVVHGIEVPDDRLASGKGPSGQVHLSLRREGTQLLIELRDDGRGLDFAAIRNTAIRRGLMPSDAEITDEEVAQFIFAAGFSTAGKVTQDAGRGIGMDVVASEVKQLGGTLELASEAGRGTRFLIRLPLTLAISQALLVSVGDEQFAVPLPSVEGIARLAREELPRYFQADGPALSYGGHEYPVRYLGDYLGSALRGDLDSKTAPVILIRIGEGLGAGERRVAVVVDQLLGNREVVSKAVGPQVSSISGVAGATILADGRVVLILDVPGLVQDRARRELVMQSLRNDRFAETGDTSVFDSSAPAEPSQDTIMVVDDSITMRRVAERLLVRNGFRVVTAKDGLDAMAMLQTEQPAVVLLDIEMPRADGFEVAAFIRNTGRISRVPIIMITSRSGEKHRERASRLGVNRYLIKPYQEEQLMDEVRSVLSEVAA